MGATTVAGVAGVGVGGTLRASPAWASRLSPEPGWRASVIAGFGVGVLVDGLLGAAGAAGGCDSTGAAGVAVKAGVVGSGVGEGAGLAAVVAGVGWRTSGSGLSVVTGAPTLAGVGVGVGAGVGVDEAMAAASGEASAAAGVSSEACGTDGAAPTCVPPPIEAGTAAAGPHGRRRLGVVDGAIVEGTVTGV